MKSFVKEKVKITNNLGLHLRAAATLVKLANTFSSDIFLEKDGKKVNAKSIMSIMALAASCGSVLVISAKGKDAKKAVLRLCSLVKNKFGEKK